MRVTDAANIEGKRPSLVRKGGRIVGCFLPFSSHSLPKELRKHIAYGLSDNVAANMKARGLSESDILESLE